MAFRMLAYGPHVARIAHSSGLSATVVMKRSAALPDKKTTRQVARQLNAAPPPLRQTMRPPASGTPRFVDAAAAPLQLHVWPTPATARLELDALPDPDEGMSFAA